MLFVELVKTFHFLCNLELGSLYLQKMYSWFENDSLKVHVCLYVYNFQLTL